MEVIYEGALEKCFQSGSKKEWKKRYFVLKRASGSNSQTIEYYKDKDWKKQDPKGVFNLLAGYHVNTIDDLQRKKFMFEITTLDSALLLASSNESVRQKWIDVLNNSLTVRSFTAVLISSPDSAAKFTENIKGPVLLQITDSAVVLSSVHTCNISWQFACIRRYKCHHGIFILEVGRKAMTGEGTFEFNTNDPQELFHVLDTALKDRMKSKAISQGAGTPDKFTFDIADPKPPPLPSNHPELKRLSSLNDPTSPPAFPIERRQSGMSDHGSSSPAPYEPKRSSSMEKVQPPPLPMDRKRPTEPRSLPHEYSRLGLAKSTDAANVHSSDGYDHLSGVASRLMAKRGSDSGILNSEKKPLHVSRSLKAASTPMSLTVEEEYMDMGSAKDVSKSKKQPPTPPTRAVKPALHSVHAPSDATYDSINDAGSNGESYYNTPSSYVSDSSRVKDQPLEYDELDHTEPRPLVTSSVSEYNHLNEAVMISNEVNDPELYDTPSGNSMSSSTDTGHLKMVAQKPSPLTPRSKLKANDTQLVFPRHVAVPGYQNSLLTEDVKRLSSESGGSQSSLDQQELYDTPRSSVLMDAYDVPASPLASAKKAIPSKPIRRPANLPDSKPKPPAPPRKKSDAENVSKLKRNLELSGFKPPTPGSARPIPGHGLSQDASRRLSDPGLDATTDDLEPATYDCPASLPADSYNRVGEIISGQYGRGHDYDDEHGYVRVRNSNDEGLYQDV